MALQNLPSQKLQFCAIPFQLTLFFFVFLIRVPSGWPETAHLSWNPNTEQNIDGYKVHYGTSSRDYSQSVDAGQTVGYEVAGLLKGVLYYFAVTAYNSSGLESDFSNEVIYLSEDSTVITGPLSTITLTPASATIQTGDTQQYAAVAKDAQGLQLSNVVFTWSSSNPNAATINETGLATGLSAGSASITASSDDVVSNPTLLQVTDSSNTVAAVATSPDSGPAAIEISPLSAVIAVDANQQFAAIAKDARGSQLSGVPITWSSSNPDSAVIDPTGMATAISVGSSEIFATADSVTSNRVALTVTHPRESYTASGGGCGFIRMRGGRPPDTRQIAANLIIFFAPLLLSMIVDRVYRLKKMRREDWIELFAFWNGLRVAAVTLGGVLFAVVVQEALTFITAAI